MNSKEEDRYVRRYFFVCLSLGLLAWLLALILMLSGSAEISWSTLLIALPAAPVAMIVGLSPALLALRIKNRKMRTRK